MQENQENSVVHHKVHIALNVKNLLESMEFYRAMFAAEPAKVRPAYVKFDIAEPPLNLALNETATDEAPAQGGGTLSHLGIQVASTDEVLAMRQRLESAGLSTREEMQTSCCYALQDKVWIRDPDGNEWEVFVVLGEAADTKKESCCDDAEPRTKQEKIAGADDLAKESVTLADSSARNETCCATAREPWTERQELASENLAADTIDLESPSFGAACCSRRNHELLPH